MGKIFIYKNSIILNHYDNVWIAGNTVPVVEWHRRRIESAYKFAYVVDISRWK